MPDNAPSPDLPHLILRNTTQAQAFKARSAGGGSKAGPPPQDRARHGGALLTELRGVQAQSRQTIAAQQTMDLQSGLGLQLEFEGLPDVALAFESLGQERGREGQHIEVLSVHTEGLITRANVFVPEGKLAHFEQVLQDYLAERKTKDGKPRDHRKLVDALAHIRTASLRSLWSDDPQLYPQDANEVFWWEVWLPVRGNRQAVLEDFRKLAALCGCRVASRVASFPERTVALLKGSAAQLGRSVLTLNCVAELRRAQDTAEFFDSLPPAEQAEWVADAALRIQAPAQHDEQAPRVCILDSGVSQAHPLLAPLMHGSDVHTINPAWGGHDDGNHGTGMASLAAWGDLTEALAHSEPLKVDHRLESVKLWLPTSRDGGDFELYAAHFADAVAQPEVTAPLRLRAFASAITSADDRNRGTPSAWSAMVDSLASDADHEGQFPRLFVLCAGNTVDRQLMRDYPHYLSTQGILDPGQAWNALTVGASTQKSHISEQDAKDLQPVAPEGGVSPYSRTSASWDSAWPLKPEVVFEGGNTAADAISVVDINSLQLLSANAALQDRLLTNFNATSAASALCARMVGQLMADYPGLNAETIRGLVVHSAEWTPAMLDTYLPRRRSSSKRDVVNLIRHCGWGSPSLERARWSAGHALTLVVEDQLLPYVRNAAGVGNRDMNLHALPWPKEALEALPPEAEVELRITLSYFIEPNPSARGTTSKFHYASHRLRFDVQRPLDASTEDFVARINAAAAREDDGEATDAADPHWLLGERQRHRGSLHQDVWRGSAAELARRGFIAVYPAKGWWRTRPKLERYGLPARYSLLVSIRTADTSVDLYTPVAQQIAAMNAVPVVIST